MAPKGSTLGKEPGGARANQGLPNVQGVRYASGERVGVVENSSHKPEEKPEYAVGGGRKSRGPTSKRQSTTSMQGAQQRQSEHSRKRSSGQGSTKLQAVASLQSRQLKTTFSEGPETGAKSRGSQEQSQGAQRQAIYSSYHLQRIPRGEDDARSAEPANSSGVVGTGEGKSPTIVAAGQDIQHLVESPK